MASTAMEDFLGSSWVLSMLLIGQSLQVGPFYENMNIFDDFKWLLNAILYLSIKYPLSYLF